MDIKQSFIMAISRVKLSLYEQRILIKCIEFGQDRLKGLWMRENLKKLSHDYDNVRITIPVKYILTDGSQHYEHVYEAARSLVSRRFEFDDDDNKTFFVTSLIYNVTLKKRSGLLSFYVSRIFFDVLYNFSKGYCQYDLQTVLSLPTLAAVRFYILMNGQHQKIYYPVETLKEIFGVADKYHQTADFIKKIVEPARLALDAANTNSFTYERIRQGQKVIKLEFTPVNRVPLSDQQLTAKVSALAILEKDIQQILTIEAGFTVKELNAHKELWKMLAKHPAPLDIVDAIVSRARKYRKEKGYIINAIRSELGVKRTKKK